MRKRVIGAGLLVAIGIGIWLSSLFKGLGPGGKGVGAGIGPDEHVKVSVDGAEVRTTQTESGTRLGLASNAGSVPTVVIDGHQYLLQMGAGAEEHFRPADMSDVVKAAQAATPDENGVRLHIKRRSSSRTTAEDALKAALNEAAVPASAIVEHQGFVD